MIVKVFDGRRDKRSSFKQLRDYLLKERDPESGEEVDRCGEVVFGNILSLETAHIEMRAATLNNTRVEEPIFHYELSWVPGERPTREQWLDAAIKTMRAVGFDPDEDGHQYIIAPHTDRPHFHVHIMVNRVHPETYKAVSLRLCDLALHKAAREVEHEQGWEPGIGLYRWDYETNQPVRTTREERAGLAVEAVRVRGHAAELEHYRDVESLQSYVRDVPAKELKTLLARDGVSWQDVHRMFARYGLELDKAEHGGYTVKVIDGELRVKASDVFRETFAGRANRTATEQKLGPWQEPQNDREIVPVRTYTPRPKRDPEKREKQREERERQRRELKAEFAVYKGAARQAQKDYTNTLAAQRRDITERLKAKKKGIRAKPIPWREKRTELSLAVAEAVAEQRLLKAEATRERLSLQPKTYQIWIGELAQAGDKRAAAQLRGWRYQDQRVINKTADQVALQRDAAHLSATDGSDESVWPELTNDRIKELGRNEELAQTIAATRWQVDRRSGDVAYLIRGRKAVVDRGKLISVLDGEEASIVLGLEMAVKKYGPLITVQGSEAWKEKVAKAAARNGVFVRFADPNMQQVMEQEQAGNNVLLAYAQRLSEFQLQIEAAPDGTLALVNRDAANTFVSAIFGTARARGYVDDLQKNMEFGTERSGNIRGLFLLRVTRGQDGHFRYTVTAQPGKGKELSAILRTAADQARVRAEHARHHVQKIPQKPYHKGRERELEGKSRD